MRTIVLIALLANLTGCAAPFLTLSDSIATTGGRAVLAAYVEREPLLGVRKGVENTDVRFFVGDMPVGSAASNDKGHVKIDCVLAQLDLREVTAKANWGDRVLTARGRMFDWNGGRPAIAVDVDHTVCDTDRDHLYFKAADDSRPITGAAATLTVLAADFEILYLTARPHAFFSKTRTWLKSNGFPDGPLIMSPGWRSTFRQESYKRDTLRQLREYLPQILIGIGDKPQDAEASRDNGMLAIQLQTKGESTSVGELRYVRNWSEIRRFFQEHRSLLTDLKRLHGCLEDGTIGDELAAP